MNIYDGCLSNNTILTSIDNKPFYEILENFQQKILNRGQKVVFVDCCGSLTSKARAVIYQNKIPEIMQKYEHRFVKINNKWIRNSLLGYCDICGGYEEFVYQVKAKPVFNVQN
jgi:DNA polymerase II large subunit